MTPCEQSWCPGAWPTTDGRHQANDGQYENRVVSGDDDHATVLVKQYRREVRFASEMAALRILGPIGLSPRLLCACWHHQALQMTRLGAPGLAAQLAESAADRATAVQLGRHLRRLHRIRASGMGPLCRPIAQPWPIFLRHHLEVRLASLPLCVADQRQVWAFLEGPLGALDPALAPRVLHHDLKPANILVHVNGGISLCDFDQARGGDPVSDLGKLWWRTFSAGDGRAWRSFLRTYTSDGDDIQERVVFYAVVHCVGALAYWHDCRVSRYHGHACSARDLLALYTGVSCSLQRDREVVA